MIKGVSHVCFYVSDIQVTYNFYVSTLGLKHVFDFTNDSGDRYGFFLHVGERTFLEFFSGRYNSSSNSSFRHLCFEVDAIDSIKQNCQQHNIEVFGEKMGKDHVKSCCIHDPDGNVLEFHEFTRESVQSQYPVRR